MQIGNQYADNKVYRGIRYYDTLPLTSEDLHEYSDTVYMKNAYIMNSIVGYGTLNSPKLSMSSSGIKLVEPSIVLINGDVSLIQSDSAEDFISSSDIESTGYSEGVVCIVGWYQHITASDTMRNYGGVENSIINNDLLENDFNIQISSRYQFRWCKVIIPASDLLKSSITLSLPNRDKTGSLLTGSTSITTNSKVDNVFIADIPTSMDYALDHLYIVPILEYVYVEDLGNVSSVSPSKPIGSKSSGFLKSDSQPRGQYPEGTVWYNSTSGELLTYVNGDWVTNASSMAFLQYQSVHVMEDTITTPSSITIPINIADFQEGDILSINYDGVVLSQIEQYDIDYEEKTVTLIQFTSRQGDKVYFTSTRIVEASDITNVTVTFNKHMNTTASKTVDGHVKLTDDMSESSEKDGVAATPKLVKNLATALNNALSTEVTQLVEYINDSKTKKSNNILINPSQYVDDDTYTEFPYKASVHIPGVTSNMVPTVTYSVKDVLEGVHCPVASTLKDTLVLYASKVPDSIVTLHSVIFDEGGRV